jgi:hypothetical protein
MTEKNPKYPQSLANALDQLRSEGFEIREQSAGRYVALRAGCGAIIETSAQTPAKTADATAGSAIRVTPGLVRRDSIAHLLDKGFQKFWQDGDRRIPARAEELKAVHAFERDLHAALGITTLYNQALGTVSAKYIYDRVEGREPGKRHESFD